MKTFTILLLLVGISFAAIDKKQLAGLKKLLKHFSGDFIPLCTMVLFKDIVDYDTADNHCKDFDIETGVRYNGNLVTVNDQEKNEDIKLLLELAYPKDTVEGKWDEDAWCWAGMRKTQNTEPNNAKERVYDAKDWEWADGSNPLDYEAWMKNMPDQKALKNGKSGCDESPKCYQNQMRVNHDGAWDDTFKFKKHPYACDYQGKYIVSPEKKSWHSAKEACEDAGLILAKVRSADELEELQTMVKFIVGPLDESLKTFHSDNWYWVGGNDINEEEKWTWVDGEVIEDWGINWRDPNPDNAQFRMDGGQNAMSISKWGQFDDSFELHRERAFACQCPST